MKLRARIFHCFLLTKQSHFFSAQASLHLDGPERFLFLLENFTVGPSDGLELLHSTTPRWWSVLSKNSTFLQTETEKKTETRQFSEKRQRADSNRRGRSHTLSRRTH